jgi:predicted transposase YdaD
MRESVIYQEIWQEWFQEGFELDLEQKAQEIARNMLMKSFDIALIIEVTR